ncbi:hypothetical protein F7P69_00865 [Cellulosimicrobium funkei]|nr:hypothetical protein [Cellulosimicrobium funkei]
MEYPTWQHARAHIARLSQTHPKDHPEIVAARQALKTMRLEEHVRGVVDSWPPLSDEQKARVGALLRPAGVGVA